MWAGETQGSTPLKSAVITPSGQELVLVRAGLEKDARDVAAMFDEVEGGAPAGWLGVAP